MYKLSILIFLAIFTISCDDDIDPSQIPSVVQNTLKSNFPHATDIEWERYGDDFEVDFEFKKIDHSARIDRTGTMLEYKFETAKNTLPPTIIKAMNTEYPDSNWEDPEILVRGNKRYYQLEIDGFLKDNKILLDSLGTETTTIKAWK